METQQIAVYSNPSAPYTIQTKLLDGRKHLVVPVVMMVAGVHAGSRGPLLHTASELSKAPASWNGIPVMIGHPQVNGMDVSANTPGVLETAVGKIFNTQMVGIKLKAEAWLDELKLQAVSPVALSYIKAKHPLDVSTGAFTAEKAIAGVYNNKRYNAIAYNLVPDHLALLPGEVGACSWTAGCGIRNNKSSETSKDENNEMDDEVILTQKQEAYESILASALVDNKQGYQAMLEQVRGRLDSLDNAMSYHMLDELYDDYLIYRVRSKVGDQALTYFQQTYKLNEDDSIEFTGNPVQVRREVKYTKISNNSGVRRSVFNSNNSNTMTKNGNEPCCPEKVIALINNKASKFGPEDEAWLLTLSADQLDKLQPVTEPVVAPVTQAAPAPAPAPVVPAPVVNTDGFIKRDSLKTAEDFLSIVPSELQDQFRSGLVLHKEHRTELIQLILNRSEQGVWTEAELEVQDTSMLEKLSKQFKTPVNYTGQGAGRVPQTNAGQKVAPLMPPAGM